jgi:hypothetical protein
MALDLSISWLAVYQLAGLSLRRRWRIQAKGFRHRGEHHPHVVDYIVLGAQDSQQRAKDGSDVDGRPREPPSIVVATSLSGWERVASEKKSY